MIAIISILALSASQLAYQVLLSNYAKVAGKDSAQIAESLRSFISRNPTAATATYSDLNFLRNVTCTVPGTATEDYYPCDFKQTIGVGTLRNSPYAINLTNLGATIEAELVIGPITVNGSARPDLSGEMALAINTADVKFFAPESQSTFLEVENDIATATLTVTTTTAASTDAWLRTDGSNTMNADLTFDSALASRSIVDVNNITGDGIVTMASFADSDDGAFFIDPDGSSSLNEINVNELTLNDSGQKLSEGIIYTIAQVAHGDIVTKPTCRTGSVPKINLSISNASADDSGVAMGAIQLWAVDISATEWQVVYRVFAGSSFMNPSSTYGRAQVITSCGAA